MLLAHLSAPCYGPAFQMHVHFPMVMAQAAGGSLLSMLPYFAALLGIIYFVMIRPQQQEQKTLTSMRGSLKKGDDVVTTSGIIGKVFAVADKTVTLEVASGVKLRILKSAIQARGSVSDDAVKAEEPAKKEEK